MRKLRNIMMVLAVMFVSVLFFYVNAEAADVAINETNFPDEHFRQYVLENVDMNSDKMLSEAEIKDEVYINLDAEEIKDLKGLQYFVYATHLSCFSNYLTSEKFTPYVSKLTKLTYLDCGGNYLKTLDVKVFPNLEILACENNELTELDVSKNTKLRKLSCAANKLSALNLSNNTKLTVLSCSDNKISTLDISKNPLIWYLSCYDNPIKTLDIHLQKDLTRVYTDPEEELTDANYAAYIYEDYGRSDPDDEDGDAGLELLLEVNKSTTIISAPKITTPATDTTKTVKAKKKVSLKVTAKGSGLKYQWYYKKPGSNKLIKVSAKAGKKATYTFKALARHDGYRYYCKVTNKYGTTTSHEIKLTVKVTPKITSPKKATTKTVKSGKVATFTVKATGASIYQWEYRVSKDAPWQEVTLASGKTAKYKLTVQPRHNGYQYRCRVSNSSGITVYSKIITLKVK